MNQPRSITCTIISVILIAIGLAVFAIRLTHPGPYAMPHGGGLYGGLGAIALGALLFWRGRLRPWAWLAVVISPIAVFPALYSIMGESEEVISLYATDASNTPADLRLWIVDREDGAWVGMGRDKAVTHSLDGQQLQMLRGGEQVCVVPKLFEDRPTVTTIHRMKVDKYKVAQVSGALGMYPLEATPATVVLRLDPCPATG